MKKTALVMISCVMMMACSTPRPMVTDATPGKPRTPSSEEYPSIKAAFGPGNVKQISTYTLQNPGTNLELLGFKDPIHGEKPVCYLGTPAEVEKLISAMEKYQNKMAKLGEAVPDDVTSYVKIKSVKWDGDKVTVKYKADDSKKKIKKANKEVFSMFPCTASFPN
jgi:hypothetical protein